MKLPFDLSLKFVFRVLIPGLVVGLASLPLMEEILARLHALAYKEIVFVALALVSGWVVLLLDMQIYMLYEGRRYWPSRLRRILVDREKARLKGLLSIDEQYRGKNTEISRQKFVEAWFDLRHFPLDEQGSPTAECPTRLGNLVDAFERYSMSRYNMDSVFYWPRLWVQLDKDLREELDNSQALADSALYTSFALYFLGVVFLLYSLYRALGFTGLAGVGDQPAATLLLIGLSGFVGGYLLYRLGLYPQASYGECFKAIIDQNQSKVDFENIVKLMADILNQPELVHAPLKDRRQVVWLYLQYYRVHPPGEEHSIPVPKFLGLKTDGQKAGPSAITETAADGSPTSSLTDERKPTTAP